MALPLSESDEPNRYCIQLYHQTASQVDLTGKEVLEVSCGAGGGASYIARNLGPASYTGLDLNPASIDLCRAKHRLPGLQFVQGDAQNLPFPDESFDAVVNVEASHQYPDFRGFLAEVARVLRPGGHFLYTIPVEIPSSPNGRRRWPMLRCARFRSGTSARRPSVGWMRTRRVRKRPSAAAHPYCWPA